MRLGEAPTVTQPESSRARIQTGLSLCPMAGSVSFSTSPPHTHTPPWRGWGSVLPSTCTWDLLIKLTLKSMHQAQDYTDRRQAARTVASKAQVLVKK